MGWKGTSFILMSCVALAACGLLFDFDYDTTRRVGIDSPDAIGAFDFDVPATISVPAGGVFAMPIGIRRRDGFAGSVLVVAEAPLPDGLSTSGAITIPEDATSGAIGVAATPESSGTRTLTLLATSSSGRQTARVEVSIMHASCSPDRSFGGTGNVSANTAGAAPGRVAGHTINATSAGIAATALDEAGDPFLFTVTPAGVMTQAPSAYQALVLQDGVIAVEHGATSTLRRQPGVGFGNGGSLVVPLAIPASGRAFVVLADIYVVGFAQGSNLSRWAVFGATLAGQPAAFGTGGLSAEIDAGGPSNVVALVPSGGGFVACGATGALAARHGVIARWTATGAADASFGSGGRVDLPPGSEVWDCAPRPGGLIIAGRIDNSSKVFALRDDGTRDSSFADLPLLAVSNPAVVDDRRGGAIVLDSASLRRLSPSGARDTTFGDAGTCSLGAGWDHLAVQPDGRLVVTSGEAARLVVTRLWP
jgi:hypothetical protein